MSGKITLTEEMLKEISESLQTGTNCYLHKKTGKIIEHMEGADFDPAWDKEGSYTQDVQDLEDSPDEYVMFSPMSSSQAYDVMEDFTNSLEIGTLKVELLNVMNQKHPFQSFKRLVENSDARQNWFDFRNAAYVDYVREEYEWKMESE